MKFLWLTLFSTAMAVCLSLTSIPHMAMSFEMSPAPRERVRIVGYRNFVGIFFESHGVIERAFAARVGGSQYCRPGPFPSRLLPHRRSVDCLARNRFGFRRYRGTGGTETSPQPVTTSFFSTLKDAFRNRMFRLI